jgi:flagellar M-ring protein FliF
LSNQPPAPATAPITASGVAQSGSASNAGLMQKDSTTNYEVDKTIRYTQQPMGGVKRISVAVVINYKNETDKNGKVTSRALTEIEKNQISDLVKEAMGYSKERGDTLNVVNSPFAGPEKEVIADIPFWKQADSVQTGKELGKYLLTALLLLYLFFGFLKPMLYKIMGKETKKERLARETAEKAAAQEAAAAAESKEEAEEDRNEDGSIVSLSRDANGHPIKPMSAYEINLDMAKQLAASDPKIVANVIKTWISNE